MTMTGSAPVSAPRPEASDLSHAHMFFRQGDHEPWTHMLEYEQEREVLPRADLDDRSLVFS